MTDMQPLPDGWNIGAKDGWVATPGWSAEVVGPEDVTTLPLVAVELIACMGGGSLVIGGARVLHDGAATDTEDLTGLHGIEVLSYHPPTESV